jgi:hypothetical protein
VIKRGDILIRGFVLLLAILQPIIIVSCYGFDVFSISSIWSTGLQPLFIITNACTSYFLFDIRGWKIPAILLLLLTAFSIEFNLVIHNILAGLFFLSSFGSLRGIRRLGWYVFPYGFSLLLWLFLGMFWGEVFAIYIICVYHINLLYIAYNFNKGGGN